MTGREAIEWYLANYGQFTCELVSEATGVKRTAIQGAAHKMREAGEIMLDRRVWRSHFYVAVEIEDDEGKPVDRSGVNTIFDECRHNWQGYQVHKIFGSRARA